MPSIGRREGPVHSDVRIVPWVQVLPHTWQVHSADARELPDPEAGGEVGVGQGVARPGAQPRVAESGDERSNRPSFEVVR